MEEIIPFKTFSNTDERKKNKQIREEQLSALKALFLEASKITEETPQRDICKLLSKTANYILKNKHYLSSARELHIKLSNCLKSKCDQLSWGFDDLKDFLNDSKFLN